MRKTLPIAEALELAKDQPDLAAQIQDIALDKDSVEVEFDEDGMQILSILKDSPTVDSSHVPSTDWGKKPRIATFSSISKAVDEEERYTFSPWYVPDSLDAHNEWTDPKEVQQAFWKYLGQDNRDIRLQHNTDIVAGEWVEGATWPFEVTVPVKHPEGDTEYTFPAGTPFLGIVWEPWAWELIKSGQIRGLSIGGSAQRAEAELTKEDYDPTGTYSFAKMIRQEDGKFELYSHDGSRHLGSFDSEEAAKMREAEINRIKHIQKSASFIVPSDFIDSLNLAKHAAYATEPTREGLASELFDVIADVVTFRFIAQGFHWNVKGINFQQFHDLFEEIYQDADDSIDPIGESIRKLNYDAPVTHKDYMGKISQMEIPETNDPEIMSQILYVANEQVRACLVKAFSIAACIDEQGIANFLAERLDMHSKWQWQLRAIVGDGFADAYEVDVAELGGMLTSGLDNHMHPHTESMESY
jgi:starvation-inducible DNA-binding protein